MVGKIIGIEENTVLIKLSLELDKIQSLIGLYVIMEQGEEIMVGEITDIKDGIAYANLLGEIIDDKFVFGVIKKPSFASVIKLVSKEKIPMIIGEEDFRENKDLYLGVSPIYDGVKIATNINKFFSGHFAIFGSTGSGKSYSTARIIQNLFEKTEYIPYRSSIFIFDAFGEYHSAFRDLNKKVPEISFKTFTTNLNFSESEIIKIPLWLLDVDDIALLLYADKTTQLPIIEKALKLVTVFGREEDLVIQTKNDIIARAILDILSSGRPPAQIRDQVFSLLTSFNTKELNLESPVFVPGYTRPLKQIIQIDTTGKIRDMELLVTFLNNFIGERLELSLPDGSFMYTMKDLVDAFEFALISEGALNNAKVYEDASVLRVRINSIANSNYSQYFDYPEYVTKEDYIRRLLTNTDGRKAQVINFNINFVDDRFAKNITKIYSRLLFEYSKDNIDNKLPFHIVLEEAHRYVQNDNDIDLLGYNIFDRITKEGRKYGVLLGLISQRPSELSETALSQCSNFLIFKMLHPTDIRYIEEMVPNITTETVKRLKILQPGICIAFGSSFKVPVLVKFDMPNPTPSSSNVDVSNIWFVERGNQ